MTAAWRRWALTATVGVLVVACSTPGAELEAAPAVRIVDVGMALHEPVWSDDRNALLGLTDDHRLVVVEDPAASSSPRTHTSAPFATGRNVQISRRAQGHVFVPQPERDMVIDVDLATLKPVGEFRAGPAPAYLSEDGGARLLLALSADGTSVTPVDQYGLRLLPRTDLTDGPAQTINGVARGRDVDYRLFGTSGIRAFKGMTPPPEQVGSLRMDVTASAADDTQVARSYVARREDDDLYAVETPRDGDGLAVIARTPFARPIRYLATDDTRVYAATDTDVVVLETNSFIGFPDHRIPVLRTIDYRSALPAAAASAPISGLAVGPKHVFVTLAGRPEVVSVAKPRL